MEEKEEKKKKMKNISLKRTQAGPKEKMSAAELDTSMKAKREMLTIEQRKAVHEICIKNERSKIMAIEKMVTAKEQQVELLQINSDGKKYMLEKFLSRVERKPVDAEAHFEKASKDIQEKRAVIAKLVEETRTLKSELNEIEDVLNRNKWYRTTLLKLSPLEWRQAQEAKTLKARNAQKEQTSEPKGSAVGTGVETDLVSSAERAMTFTFESMQSSTPGDTEVTNSNPDSDRDGDKKKLGLYFSDPLQVVVLLSELRDQILSLIQNSTEMDKVLEQTIEFTMNKMKEDKEKLTLQVNNMKDRVDTERSRAVMLRKKVQLHDLSTTHDHDIMLAALARNVTNVYSSCSNSRFTNLSTLEKLCSVECSVALLQQEIECIPEDIFKALWQIKDTERKSRMQEQKLRQEREKQIEMSKKCIERAMGDVKKNTGRKLMPRCIQVKQKIQVTDEPTAPPEEDLQADLFSEVFD